MQISNDDISKLVSQSLSSESGQGPGSEKDALSRSNKSPGDTPETTSPPPTETLFAAVENLNQVLRQQQHSVRLKASEFAETAVIEIVDKETNTVIRQIPNESTVKLAEYWSQNGLLADDSLISLSVDETA